MPASAPAPRKIAVSAPQFEGNEAKYVQECLETTWISSIGRFIPLFEQGFAEYCEVEHAIAANNGTSALHLALLGMGVGPGDEVIVPTLTFVATANAVAYCGAKPVFIDSEPRTMNLDPALLEGLITPKTKGILAVHLYGHPADMDAILAVARRHNLFVIEDAAEAHGALYRGRKVGGLGDAGTFSFFGNKIITTGEGGMVTLRDPERAARIRIFRGQGMQPDKRYWFPVIGYNYRMTNIQAAIGLAQLEQIDRYTAHHWRVADWYAHYLSPLAEAIALPREEAWAKHAYWLYTVVLGPAIAASRDEVMAGLAEAGIETRPVFYPMHVMEPFFEEGACYPVAERLSAQGLSLPTHIRLTEEDVAYIAGHLLRLCNL
jgi:perosamine synthetase